MKAATLLVFAWLLFNIGRLVFKEASEELRDYSAIKGIFMFLFGTLLYVASALMLVSFIRILTTN